MKRDGILSIALGGLVWVACVSPVWASDGHQAGEKGLPQMDASLFPGLLFWLGVTFVLFFVMMKWLGVPGVQETKARRKGVIDLDLVAAREARDAAQKIMDLNEDALAQARGQAKKTVDDIIQAADGEALEMREKQQKELAHRLQVAEDNLNEARAKAMEETPQFINDLVQEIVTKVTRGGLSSLRDNKVKG